MKLYLAMKVRGEDGNLVTADQMQSNKKAAVYVANRIRASLLPEYEVICPHEDEELNKIDADWIQTRDPALVPKAMNRCYELLSPCNGILLFGYLSEGMESEKRFSLEQNMFVFEREELNEETLEELIHELIYLKELSAVAEEPVQDAP